MGRLAEFFREQSIVLDGQKKQKMLSLDRQFVEMETERDRLKAENLSLKAKVNPLEREVERLKQEVQSKAAHDDSLDEIAVTLLQAIADSDGRMPKYRTGALLKMTKAQTNYYFGLLERKKYIYQSAVDDDGELMYATEQGGLEYLAKRNKL